MEKVTVNKYYSLYLLFLSIAGAFISRRGYVFLKCTLFVHIIKKVRTRRVFESFRVGK